LGGILQAALWPHYHTIPYRTVLYYTAAGAVFVCVVSTPLRSGNRVWRDFAIVSLDGPSLLAPPLQSPQRGSLWLG
jgi:hypothetical protein